MVRGCWLPTELCLPVRGLGKTLIPPAYNWQPGSTPLTRTGLALEPQRSDSGATATKSITWASRSVSGWPGAAVDLSMGQQVPLVDRAPAREQVLWATAGTLLLVEESPGRALAPVAAAPFPHLRVLQPGWGGSSQSELRVTRQHRARLRSLRGSPHTYSHTWGASTLASARRRDVGSAGSPGGHRG